MIFAAISPAGCCIDVEVGEVGAQLASRGFD
jgi:hypothetical protein